MRACLVFPACWDSRLPLVNLPQASKLHHLCEYLFRRLGVFAVEKLEFQ